VIELVDLLEAQDEWGIPVLFEHDGRKKGRLEAMGRAVADDSPKTAERRPDRRRFRVVRQPVEEVLNGERRPEPGDEPALFRTEAITLGSGLRWSRKSQHRRV